MLVNALDQISVGNRNITFMALVKAEHAMGIPNVRKHVSYHNFKFD